MPLAVDPQLHSIFPSSAKEGSDRQLLKACEEFEAFFIQAVFKSMRQTIPEGGMIERGNGQKWFEEFMDAEVADSLAQKSDLGIARALYQEMAGTISRDNPLQSPAAREVHIKG
ncbi:MAG: rod-binding protein [Desulfovermiculus sp.]